MAKFSLFRRGRKKTFVDGMRVTEVPPAFTQLLNTLGRALSPEYVYRTQPAVSTCVDFLAKNIAQLGLKVYERSQRTSRTELPDHPLALLINNPSPTQTRFRQLQNLVSDLCLYDFAIWRKVRSGSQLALVRVPPPAVIYRRIQRPSGGFRVALIVAQTGEELVPDQIVYFRGYSPTSDLIGTSSIEKLQGIIAEEVAAMEYRRYFWKNAARMEGVLQRPIEAPEWGREGRERFMEDWRKNWTGATQSGKTGLLEEGMSFVPYSFNPEQSQFIQSRKFSREEAARAFGIPLPMVGLLESATFASLDVYERLLYAETLAPWLEMIQQEIELQVLPEFDIRGRIYVEFNLKDKLKGNFAEQTAAYMRAAGGPWMTRNEVRALENMPPIPGGDEIVIPQNVLIGGGPQPAVNEPTAVPEPKKTKEKALSHSKAIAERRNAWAKDIEDILVNHFDRQQRVLKSKQTLGEDERWDRELLSDLLAIAKRLTTDEGSLISTLLGYDFGPHEIENYLQASVAATAASINAVTRFQLSENPDITQVFKEATNIRAVEGSVAFATQMMAFSAQEAAKQAPGIHTKTWRITSENSRHDDVDGETTGVAAHFSNGLAYPGDPAAPTEQTAGCQCVLEVQ